MKLRLDRVLKLQLSGVERSEARACLSRSATAVYALSSPLLGFSERNTRSACKNHVRHILLALDAAPFVLRADVHPRVPHCMALADGGFIPETICAPHIRVSICSRYSAAAARCRSSSRQRSGRRPTRRMRTAGGRRSSRRTRLSDVQVVTGSPENGRARAWLAPVLLQRRKRPPLQLHNK